MLAKDQETPILDQQNSNKSMIAKGPGKSPKLTFTPSSERLSTSSHKDEEDLSTGFL